MSARGGCRTAIYDTIPKKPTARESIRDKLEIRAESPAAPYTETAEIKKESDMVPDMKNFTVEELNLMCCFNTSSREAADRRI